MLISSWNVNSVRARIENIKSYLLKYKPDILMMQEIKTEDVNFPYDDFSSMDYESHVFGQKSYNGVAFISKIPLDKIEKKDFLKCGEARHISIVTRELTIHNFYFPTGGDIPDSNLNKKFHFKLEYIKEVENYFNKKKPSRSILVGDLNIAPEIDDVWDHKKLLNVVSHTPIEVNQLKNLQKTGDWVDLFRKHNPKGKYFSWWSYRSKDWKLSNKGRRLDHIWVSTDIRDSTNCYILRSVRDWDKTSDHAPVIAEFKI